MGRELLLAHSVIEPPWRVVIFQPHDIGNIANFIVDNYFRHYSMYKYCFTPEVELDVKLTAAPCVAPNVAEPETAAPTPGNQHRPTKSSKNVSRCKSPHRKSG